MDLEDLAKELEKYGEPVLAREVRKSKPRDLNELIDYIKSSNYGSNMATTPGLYFDPGAEVRTFEPRLSVEGFNIGSRPQTAFANKKATPETYAHEVAHTQQRRSGWEPKKDLRYSPMNPAARALDNTGRWLRMNENANTVPGSREGEARHLPWNAGDSLQELLAALQGKEGNLPAGQNIFDQEPYKSIINSPRQRRALEQRMFPMQNKVFPSNFDFPDEKMDLGRILEMLRRKARNFTAG